MTRVTMHDFEEQSYSFGRSYLSMGSWSGETSAYRTGHFRSSHGLVEIYEYVGKHPGVSMRFIHKGTEHLRRWNTSWGDKTIARLARELVETIIARDLQDQGVAWVEHR